MRPHHRDAAPRRFHHRGGQWPRHPRRRRAQDRVVRRGSGAHEAPRGRQVRKQRLQRGRRPARRGLLRGQRPEHPPGRGSGPRRQDIPHGIPPRPSRRVHGCRPRGTVPRLPVQEDAQRPADAAARRRHIPRQAHRHAHTLLVRSRDLQRHRALPIRPAHRPCAPDHVPRAGAAHHCHRRKRRPDRGRCQGRPPGSGRGHHADARSAGDRRGAGRRR